MEEPRRRLDLWFRKPILVFLEMEASGGILLLVATLIALVWANSSFRESYEALWHTPVFLGWGDSALNMDLHHWINDGLMALFFFYVGLEIKREVLTGELASWKKAALPGMAALGGMVVPALIYVALNHGQEGARGWGIPMATDIAFALGILMLLGKRVPLGLKVFLTALAVVDDLGAVLVIAIFYSSGISLTYLGAGLGILVVLILLARAGTRRRAVFVVLGTLVWFCFLKSGVHATVAGVLVALAIPHRVEKGRREFLGQLDEISDEMWDADRRQEIFTEERQITALQTIRELVNKAGSPLQRLEHELHPLVAFIIMPVFALANAGVELEGGALAQEFALPVPLGIILGLFLGKQVGVFVFSWLSVRLGWAHLPRNTNWKSIYGTAILAGIGFTMSLFITNLAFGTKDGAHHGAMELVDQAKLGIILASAVSAVVGLLVLWRFSGPGAHGESEEQEETSEAAGSSGRRSKGPVEETQS